MFNNFKNLLNKIFFLLNKLNIYFYKNFKKWQKAKLM